MVGMVNKGRENSILAMGYGGISPYALINSIMATSACAESKLTPEEKAERREQRRIASEERMRQAKILQNVCPDCSGKLVRGKKDKKNNYKRVWACGVCGRSHIGG